MSQSWLLNINNFTSDDRLKISEFILDTNNRWTQSTQVQLFEQKIAKFINCKYALFVSSGSTANTILAQYTKDKNLTTGKNLIILPSTTWQTSCSPWIREGFEPIFVDISLKDFSIDKNQLLEVIKKYHKNIAVIFPTSLIGFVPDIDLYQKIHETYNIPIMMDNCENTLGLFKNNNISSYFTCTTSTYFGHQIQSIEGGFIFTNNIEEYEYFLMLRNHGMTRSLDAYSIPNKYINKEVDSLFDFYCLGNNYRNTDLNAFIGQLDLERAEFYKTKRIELYKLYHKALNKNKYYLPETREFITDVPFCLPVIAYDRDVRIKALELCKKSNIEYRPIISGFLGYQTCYKNNFSSNYNNERSYNNSKFLHNNGFYVGLHASLQEDNIQYLAHELNSI